MNCDVAFDLLTRGPVPAGDTESDAALERHLAACHDCRRLAEAMRPAVGLFHEVIDESGTETDALPCYRGGLPAADGPASGLAVLERGPVAPTATSPSGVESRRTAWPVVAVGVAGLLIGAGFAFLGSPSRDAASASAGARPTRAVQLLDEDSHERLAALVTTPDCRPRFVLHGAEGRVAQCCSVCHLPRTDEEGPRANPAALAKSCLVCHVEASEPSTSLIDVHDRVVVAARGTFL